MVKRTNKIEEFSWEERKRYSDYVGDSYTHAKMQIPKNYLKILDYFFEINKMIKGANERYER